MASLSFTNWIVYPPVRQFYDAKLGKKLSDIESHVPAVHIYRDNDCVTHCHETTHFINSNIRNQYKTDGYYLFGNAAAIFKSPKVTIKQIAAKTKYRGSTYNLYLIQQQRYWNNDPLYILDELTCYSNGSWVGIELNLNRSESLTFALEFCFYAKALQETIDEYDPNYSDKTRLWQFIDWHTRRTFALVKISKGTKMANDNHDALMAKFKNPAVRMYMTTTQCNGCKACLNRIKGYKK